MERGPRPKSTEHRQAQVEAFADKGTKVFSDTQKKFLKYSAELATIDDLDNLPAGTPEELVELITAHKQEYIDFLRTEKNTEIAFRKENAKRYKATFQPTIRALKSKLESGDARKFPEYLGSGRNGSAFKINVDGQAYAAKFSKSIAQANFEIKPLLRAQGIDHVSQLVAYSFEDGVVIMNLLPGIDVTHIPPEVSPTYTDEQIIHLIEKVQELDEKGIVIDPNPSNFLYDEKEGFSVLDFHLKTGVSDTYSLGDRVMDLRLALTARDWPSLNYRADDYTQKADEQNTARAKIYLPMMVRFLTILQEKFPGILEDWRQATERRGRDPRVVQTPIIDRRHITTDDPDNAAHLEQLKKMGF